jgi:hypothetical protein
MGATRSTTSQVKSFAFVDAKMNNESQGEDLYQGLIFARTPTVRWYVSKNDCEARFTA